MPALMSEKMINQSEQRIQKHCRRNDYTKHYFVGSFFQTKVFGNKSIHLQNIFKRRKDFFEKGIIIGT